MIVDAVIVAAGGSTRFGGADKLLADLCGVPVLARAIGAYQECGAIERIFVVASGAVEAAVLPWGDERRLTKLAGVVAGGARRRDSVEAGLRASRSRYVAIHDGARPLVRPGLIERVIAGADGHPGAIAALPVADTVKEVSDGLVVGHPERAQLWAAQTPQVLLRQAWLDAAGMSDNDETDDAAMVARLGLECAVVEGDPENLKITRPLDLKLAEAILKGRGA